MSPKGLFGTAALVLLVTTALLNAGCRATPVAQPGGQAGGAAAEQAGPPQDREGGTAEIKAVASFFPVYDLVRRVGGNRVSVETLIPFGGSPHGWEPSPQEVKKVRDADVYFSIGAGLEPWSERLLEAVPNPGRVAVELSHNLTLLEPGAADHSHEESGDDDHTGAVAGEQAEAGHDDEHGRFDPHVWVDPVNARIMAERIRDTLIQVDPEGAALYRQNAAALLEELAALDREYQQLASCSRQEIILSHAFFSYPAQRYGLRQIGITGISAEAEPGPRELAALVEVARETGATHIFFEGSLSDRLARTIAQEVGLETLVLDPGTGVTAAEVSAGKGLVDVLRQNLDNLRTGLGCPAS